MKYLGQRRNSVAQECSHWKKRENVVEGYCGSFLATFFNTTWKSAEEWSCRAKLAASPGMQLSSGKSGINFSASYSLYLTWSNQFLVLYLFCLPIQSFLVVWCTPALTYATASMRNWWLNLYLLATVNANSYVRCELCTGFTDLISGRI